MVKQLQFKGYLYYLIETEDEFIKEKTRQIFNNPKQRVILIVGKIKDTHIIFRSSIDKIDYKVKIDDFLSVVDIKEKFNVLPN